MDKKYYKNATGMTLIEVLTAIAILSVISSVVYGVFTNTEKTGRQIQSHVNLRQDANIIITQLRHIHQEENAMDQDKNRFYEINTNDLLPRSDIQFTTITLNECIYTEKKNKLDTPCLADKQKDLIVKFTLQDKKKLSI
ncbi:PulJ/GspJ family protein [Cytobacillus purgationiresistens]|uniref:Prepilin-type N-terminal cleavage/methylation domain-containing protein n=1 Tax=Cytobacillus purgationiresistens TaxID=863449 RepID=A0ABU0AFF7_9BACI|nr:prepilin-type N-terminal cleavage/methylation domain-containing protein [Cytobacillus purgationiresistens]MDQ0269994.1 prepilin-type N-terminal cleavage/methylation domain-containing protein [Cytobacillus purgationiresistens]